MWHLPLGCGACGQPALERVATWGMLMGAAVGHWQKVGDTTVTLH